MILWVLDNVRIGLISTLLYFKDDNYHTIDRDSHQIIYMTKTANTHCLKYTSACSKGKQTLVLMGISNVFTPLVKHDLTLNLLNLLNGLVQLPLSILGISRWKILMLANHQYRAWTDWTDVQAVLALY